MRNFSIVYSRKTDDYFDVENNSLFWGEKFDGTDYEKYLDASEDFDSEELYKIIREYRAIIVKDFERYLKYIIPLLKNTEGLAFEMQNVVDTLNNGVDYTIDDDYNFLILTDEYLYFNNIENAIDDLLLGSLDKDEAFIYITTVIVNRNYKEFYFITKGKNLLTVEENCVVKAYSIVDGKVSEKIFKQNVDTESENYSDEDMEKLLVKVRELENN